MTWSLLRILLALCAVACAVGFYKFVYFLFIGYGFVVALGGVADEAQKKELQTVT